MKRREEKEKELEKVPRIVMDYLYMTEGHRENGKRPIFCMKDESTGCRFARAVEQKRSWRRKRGGMAGV